MYLALDPSGTITSSLFCYWHWNKWQFQSYQAPQWQKHVEWTATLINKYQPELIIYESTPYLKGAVMNQHFQSLLKTIAGLELLCYQKSFSKQEINSSIVQKMSQKAKNQQIPGLVYNQQWSFKGQAINEHEKDALLCFYLYWTRIKREDWPWIS